MSNYYGTNGNDNITIQSTYTAYLGYLGDDTYLYPLSGGPLDVYLYETGGNDTIEFENGIDWRKISVYRENDGLYITTAENGSITIQNNFTDPANQFETLEFQGKTIDLTDPNLFIDYVGGSSSGTIWGTSAEDIIIGHYNVNIRSLEGDDFIIGGGAGYINSGDGNDTIYQYSEDFTGANIIAGNGNDTIYVYGPQVFAGDGDDVIYALYSDTTYSAAIHGDAGNDEIYGTENDEQPLFGGDGNDLIYGYGGDDYLYGDAGNDELYGGNGNDQLFGGDGDDLIYGEDGNDLVSSNGNGVSYVYGGDGDDEVRGGWILGEPAYIGTKHLYGGNGNDIIRDGFDDDFLYGDAGNDTLYSHTGNDVLRGDTGDDILIDVTLNLSDTDTDTLYGDDGNDILDSRVGTDLLKGGNGNDTYITFGYGDIILDESGANDVLQMIHAYSSNWSFSVSGLDLILTSDASTPTGDTYGTITLQNHFNIDNTIEEIWMETLDTNATEIDGRHYNILSTAEELTDGNDTYTASTSPFGLDSNFILAKNGNDTVYAGVGDDFVYGGNGNDLLKGQGGDDTLYGQAGDDDLRGDKGFDTLYGGGGDDNLRGGGGNDTLSGGTGADRLEGGGGDDLFLFEGSGSLDSLNRVVDFNVGGNEVIRLDDVLDGIDPLSVVISDYITLTQSATHTYINFDQDGTGTTHSFQQAIRIENISGQWTDLQDMITQGDLEIV